MASQRKASLSGPALKALIVGSGLTMREAARRSGIQYEMLSRMCHARAALTPQQWARLKTVIRTATRALKDPITG